MLKSRYEIGEQRDDSKVRCTCGHPLEDHDYPVGPCFHQCIMKESKSLKIIMSCDCTSFERATPSSDEDGEN